MICPKTLCLVWTAVIQGFLILIFFIFILHVKPHWRHVVLQMFNIICIKYIMLQKVVARVVKFANESNLLTSSLKWMMGMELQLWIIIAVHTQLLSIGTYMKCTYHTVSSVSSTIPLDECLSTHQSQVGEGEGFYRLSHKINNVSMYNHQFKLSYPTNRIYTGCHFYVWMIWMSYPQTGILINTKMSESFQLLFQRNGSIRSSSLWRDVNPIFTTHY